MVGDKVVHGHGIHDVRVTGEDIYVITLQDFQHFAGVLDVLGLSREQKADGAVLGHIDVRALGNIGEEPFHEVQGLLRISFLIIIGRLAGVFVAAGLEDEVLYANHKVPAQPEGIVVRAEGGLVGSPGGHTALVLDVVVVADDGIEGNAGGGDGLLVGIEHLQLVPGNVSEGDAHGGTQFAVLLTHALQVSERAAQEALKVFLVLHLRVRHREKGVVGTLPERLQVKVKRLVAGDGQVELRRAGGKIGHIAGRRDDKDIAGFLVGVQGEGAIGLRGGETVSVADDDAREGLAAALDAAFNLLCLKRERQEKKADDNAVK